MEIYCEEFLVQNSRRQGVAGILPDIRALSSMHFISFPHDDTFMTHLISAVNGMGMTQKKNFSSETLYIHKSVSAYKEKASVRPCIC